MNKGFTLIELLAIIVIIGIIGLIVVPQINDLISDQRDKLYNDQVHTIEQAAEGWSVHNTNRLSEDAPIYVSLDELADASALKSRDIKDPRSNTVMNGCVEIKYDSNQYLFKFINSDAVNYEGQCEGIN